MISGDGFTSATLLQLSGITYSTANANISYNQITLQTRSAPSSVANIVVYVNGVQATCSATPNCAFTFSSSIAPSIISASPLSVSDAATITITGTQFGTDITKLMVTIGTQVCSVQTVTNTQLTCNVPGLNLGAQLVSINLAGNYFLKFKF